ncbi:MAG: phage holin family protein [Meiothermus sp.]|uniref:phage holin family protein n=1 Tax=Meiothermus sp. TaxID=1955249 RepID=UPI0025F711E4|nr:phage holin family protein [Meiothermus sp.]MCS7068674.1 phage holin family protein [Meiothermus sp.]MCX7600770.1 phage holin family protein [Meiothermus sp.]
MRDLLLRLLLNTLALWIVTQLYGGIYFARGSGLGDYVLAGLIFGLANALLRPVLLLLALPFNILTLGLFTLVVNAVVLLVVAGLTPLDVRGFGGALIGAILLSIISFGLNLFIGPAKQHRVR